MQWLRVVYIYEEVRIAVWLIIETRAEPSAHCGNLHFCLRVLTARKSRNERALPDAGDACNIMWCWQLRGLRQKCRRITVSADRLVVCGSTFLFRCSGGVYFCCVKLNSFRKYLPASIYISHRVYNVSFSMVLKICLWPLEQRAVDQPCCII